jgi:hypothetical protein
MKLSNYNEAKRSRTLQRNLVFAFSFALLSGASEAATLYVKPFNANEREQSDAPPHAYRTISQAIENLRDGDRVVIAEGIYRDAIDFRRSRAKAARQMTIEGAPGAKVVIKGSDIISDWEPRPDGAFVKRNWPHNSQQVFIDGVALKQIGGKVSKAFSHPKVDVWPAYFSGNENDLVENSFYYDDVEKVLYVKPAGGTLAGRTVEVSVRPRLLFGTGLSNITLKNLEFTHSNSSALDRSGAVVLHGNDITVERISVTWTDSLGINLTGDNNTLKDSVSNYNGQTGLIARGRNVKLINNETSHNNTRGFNKFWEAGGIKCMGPGGSSPSGLLDSTIERHTAAHNSGNGIWLDTDNRNVIIRNSEVAYNDGDGIHYEISYTGAIVGNYVFGNRLRGIYLSNAVATAVEHNLVVANELDGIAINGERSSDPKYAAVNNRVVRNIVAWNGKTQLRLPPTEIPSVSNENLFVGAREPMFGEWRKPLYRSVSGLSHWIEMSGQDKNSWQKLMPLPPVLEAKIRRRETDLDWPMLMSIASQLDVAAARRPGPQN